ncbi:MAG TPA: ferritin-like protein [Polyangiaceae bacterium]|jgi:hypothetical protein|nr:ferritin-like protein [Polyangiaceae bacterium]
MPEQTAPPPLAPHRADAAARTAEAADGEHSFVIEHREALIYMLCQAAELEHGLMCEYLFAAFTLKARTDEGLTEEQLRAVERWRKIILGVAAQEMLHLTIASNLLSALGMAPHLVRPNMPHPARHYPPGVTVALLPFGEAALRHFMFLERPEGMNLDDTEVLAATKHAVPLVDPDAIAPVLQNFATVGHLYRAIEVGFRRLVEKWGEKRVFVGPPRAQAKPEHFQWKELVVVTDLASAVRAIETIVEQGEGPRGDWKAAHFGRFKSVFDEFMALRAEEPSFEPARPVLAATVWPTESGNVPRITNHETARIADWFNVAYEVLLQVLSRFFSAVEETDEQRSALADVAVGLMFDVIGPLGRHLTELPAGPEYPGKTAGPSFELFYTSDYLFPHRRAAWILMEERLREAAAYGRRLTNAALEPLASVATAFDRLAARLHALIEDPP